MGKDKHQTQPGLKIREISVSAPFNLFFPPELRGKRVSLKLPDNCEFDKQSTERLARAEKSLKDYLKTENPTYLFEACENNIKLFTLSFDRPKSAKVQYVDPKEIFWTTVAHWSTLAHSSMNRGTHEILTGYLKDLGGGVFAPPHKISAIWFDSFGISHKRVRAKGGEWGFGIVRPMEFKWRYDIFRAIFEAGLQEEQTQGDTKRRYLKKESKLEAVKRIIEELPKKEEELLLRKPESNFIDFTDEQFEEMNIRGVSEITQSYIALRHSQECKVCIGLRQDSEQRIKDKSARLERRLSWAKQKGDTEKAQKLEKEIAELPRKPWRAPSYKTIERLYNKACGDPRVRASQEHQAKLEAASAALAGLSFEEISHLLQSKK